VLAIVLLKSRAVATALLKNNSNMLERIKNINNKIDDRSVVDFIVYIGLNYSYAIITLVYSSNSGIGFSVIIKASVKEATFIIVTTLYLL